MQALMLTEEGKCHLGGMSQKMPTLLKKRNISPCSTLKVLLYTLEVRCLPPVGTEQRANLTK